MDLNFSPQSPGQPLLIYAQSIICMQRPKWYACSAAQCAYNACCVLHCAVAALYTMISEPRYGGCGFIGSDFFLLLALEVYYPGLGNLLLASGEKMT